VKVTGIGGGHGLAVTLAAARRYADDVEGVVSVADDGGSSGRLTRELDIPPPGDIRNCLVALADDSELAHLFQHRFEDGALSGHTIGNLIIAGLTETCGDFAEAVERAGRLIGARGRVHPATTDLVGLVAEVNGSTVRGQVAVQTATSIQAVCLAPRDARANPRAVEAIASADQVVVGPGSLFTSVIAALLVPGIGAALKRARGRRVFVCNTRVQPGETLGLDAAAHLEALMVHTGPDPIDAVVVQCPPVTQEGVEVNEHSLDFLGVEAVYADIAAAGGRHDPQRLAGVLASLV
jgi:uncharacterized cofD-like protein